MTDSNDKNVSRREFVHGAVAGAVMAAAPAAVFGASGAHAGDKAAVMAQIPGMHADNLKRLQDWIALPSIAAENRNYPQGAEYMAKLAKDAGFTDVKIIPTSGKPGVFGRLDAGAKTTVAVYFMYDVKQFVPAEWSSPPLEARLVEKPGLGTVCMGRGAVNQKGPQNSFLSALQAFKASGKKLPVNLVLVCEGEEEIASPHFGEIVNSPDVFPHMKGCAGVLLPGASQGLDGSVEVAAGAKGVVELELVSSGEAWGRGPKKDIHSSLEAQVDSPSWHLVQALNTLVEKDGHTPAVEGFFEKVKPLSDAQKKMVLAYVAAVPEATSKTGVRRAALGARRELAGFLAAPVLATHDQHRRIGGRLHGPGRQDGTAASSGGQDRHAAGAGYDGGGHARQTQGAFGETRLCDIEVNMSGGYDPTQTDPDSKFFKAVVSTFTKLGTAPLVVPRNPGSWPGYRFTAPP